MPTPHPGTINARLVVIVCAVAAPLLWFSYMAVDRLVYGGIKPHEGWLEVDLRAIGYFPSIPIMMESNRSPSGSAHSMENGSCSRGS